MKSSVFTYLAWILAWMSAGTLWADQGAVVTEVVNQVTHGSSTSGSSSRAVQGTVVLDGEYVETHANARAQMTLPTTSVTRLGANTIFNYSVGSNTVDLQEGDILFSKPPDARKLNITTAAITAGITGTTGFISVRGEGRKKTYILGLINGHAIAKADDHPFLLGPGDVLQFQPGAKPFIFAFDVPRFVKSSSLVKGFHSTLPTQSAIDKELADYADDVSRGFIAQPSGAINYSGSVPLLSTIAFSSAQNAQAMQKTSGSAPPPPPPPSSPGTYPGSANGGPSSFH